MKKFKSIILTVALSLVFFACEQEVTELKPNVYSPAGTPSGNSGSADFSKFVSIGGAYVAGFGDGGLLHSGLQPYSVGRMVAVQLAKAGGSSTFVQVFIYLDSDFYVPGDCGFSCMYLSCVDFHFRSCQLICITRKFRSNL